MSRPRSYCRLALVSATTLALMTLLWVKTRSVDMARHQAVVDAMRAMFWADQELNELALRARFGLVNNYDRLSSARDLTWELRDSLRAGIFPMSDHESQALDAALNKYAAAAAEKRELLDAFKSELAVLRNSLQYYPILTDRLEEAARQFGDRALEQQLLDLEKGALLFSLRGDVEYKEAVESNLQALANLHGVPDDLAELIRTTLTHTRSIIEHKSLADDLLGRILAVPTLAVGEALFNEYRTLHSVATVVCDRYRVILYIVCVMLVAWSAWMMIRLRVSAVKLRIANETLRLRHDELQQSNARIEREVVARTKDLAEKVAQLSQEMAERQLVEAALRESEHRFRSVASSVCDAIVAADSTGCIVSWNPAAQRMFGYSDAEAMGRPLTIIIPSEHQAAHTAGLKRVTDGGIPRVIGRTIELMGRHKNGTSVALELTLGQWGTGGKAIYSAVLRDITDRKRAETADRERRHLEEALLAMDQVIGVIGHELRTPLAALRAMSEYILTEQDAASHDSFVFLKGMNDEIVRMADMVNQMLEAARINSGSARWNWSEFKLSRVCADALDVIRPLVNPQRVQLIHDCPVADVKMRGDADAIRRLLLNLLGNADKYTSDGIIRLHVAPSTAGENPMIEIVVEDSGEGIPPEVITKLGSAFALNSGVVGASNVKGSGLGLAICRGIVAAHGGLMSVASNVNQGTRIRVMLRADLPHPCDTRNTRILQERTA